MEMVVESNAAGLSHDPQFLVVMFAEVFLLALKNVSFRIVSAGWRPSG